MSGSEFLEKARVAVDQAFDAVDQARRSESAGKIRDGAVNGFTAAMKFIFPEQSAGEAEPPEAPKD